MTGDGSIKKSGNAIQGKIPIDGVDLLAKHNQEVCIHLISLAKQLANTNELKIVHVS